MLYERGELATGLYFLVRGRVELTWSPPPGPAGLHRPSVVVWGTAQGGSGEGPRKRVASPRRRHRAPTTTVSARGGGGFIGRVWEMIVAIRAIEA